MSGQSDWVGEPGRPGWLGRLVSPGDQRPGTAAFLLAAAAAVAFVVSLASDWITVTASLPGQRDSQSLQIYGAEVTSSASSSEITLATSNNITNLDMLGLIYGLGGLALLAAAGAVLTRPDLALRIRMAVAGLGVGVVAVAVAAVIRLPTLLLTQGTAYGGFGSPTDIARSYRLGLFCAFAVGVLPVVAVWVRSAPAARLARAGSGYPRSGYGPAEFVERPPLLAPSDPTNGSAPVPPAPSQPDASQPVAHQAVAPEARSRFGSRETAAGRSHIDPVEPYDLSVTPDD